MPKRTDIKKILVIGSGPIVIGQAAEFDYAGTQACLALKEEGYEVVLCNSNPATIMTDTTIADKVYMEPLTLEYIAKIIRYERPDAILPGIGGQTGLNLAMQLEKKGILAECRTELLGTRGSSIEQAEDRELFKELCESLGEPVLPSEIATSMEEGLAGMEFASGIPGSIGGGIVMNAGAYGGEMRQIVESVTVLNADGEEMELDCDTMEFGYRTSVIRNRPFIVTQAVLKLVKGEKEEIRIKMEEFAVRRRAKQPLEYPSAGSAFKRPEGYFAGKLIMDSGLRGYRVGGAQVSEKHCGFIINTGNATSEDIAELMTEVQERVKERFGVLLEPEIVRLGNFSGI